VAVLPSLEFEICHLQLPPGGHRARAPEDLGFISSRLSQIWNLPFSIAASVYRFGRLFVPTAA
jgi:hypothetical protein